MLEWMYYLQPEGYDHSVLKNSPEDTIYQAHQKCIGAKGRNITKKSSGGSLQVMAEGSRGLQNLAH